jgi:hypothetical protein
LNKLEAHGLENINQAIGYAENPTKNHHSIKSLD